jgi:hypothetical protein
VVSFAPWPLYPEGNRPWYPLDRRLGGAQSRSGRGGEEKNSQPLLGLEPPIIQPIAQRYKGQNVKARRYVSTRHAERGEKAPRILDIAINWR